MFTSDGSAKWSCLHIPLAKDQANSNWHFVVSQLSSKSKSDWLWRENLHFNQESGKDELLGIPPMLASDGSAEWSCLHTPLAKDQANSNWHFVVSQLLQVKI